MGFWSGLWAFFTTASSWSGADGIGERLAVQAELCVVVLVVVALVGGAVGFGLGHLGRGGLVVVNLANAARAVPSLALLTLLALEPSIGLRAGGLLTAAITLAALGIPPVLTNAYVGLRDVDADVREAARASGMTRLQRFWHVEVPLALPLALAGLRVAAVEVVATSTLAAYVTVNDLGEYIFSGLATQNSVETVGGALLVALLALAFDGVVVVLGGSMLPGPLRPGLARPRRGALRRRLLGSPG